MLGHLPKLPGAPPPLLSAGDRRRARFVISSAGHFFREVACEAAAAVTDALAGFEVARATVAGEAVHEVLAEPVLLPDWPYS